MRINGYYAPHKFHAVLDYVAQEEWKRQDEVDSEMRRNAKAVNNPITPAPKK